MERCSESRSLDESGVAFTKALNKWTYRWPIYDPSLVRSIARSFDRDRSIEAHANA